MEKTIKIDGRDVRFRSSGALPIVYRAYTGRNLFADVMQLDHAFENLETEFLEDMIWCAAKLAADHAGEQIDDQVKWFDGFDAFPIFDVFTDLNDLFTSALKTSKKA